MNITERLISHFKSRAAAAKAFGIGREALRLWHRNGVPLSRALDVETVMGGEIMAEDVIHEARGKHEELREGSMRERVSADSRQPDVL